MHVRTLKEAVPPIIPFVAGLFILGCAGVDAYRGKIHLKGGGDVYRAVDPNGFLYSLILEFVIAILLLALWVFEISS